MPLALELTGVSFAYPQGPEVLRDIDLAIGEGEFVAIAGPNGGGKTTLLRVALGLERPTRGDARIYGEPADGFRQRSRIAYLPQRAELALDAPISVREVVETGRVARRGVLGPLRNADRAIVEEVIGRVGLGDRRGAVLTQLSGGQQQRALIAKALAGRPDLIVLDEPTAGVDVDAQESLARLLDELHRDLGVTILFVSHEFGAVEHFVERLVLVRGGIVYDGPPRDLPATWHDPSHVHL
jgi:zinc transport system ATP-binding protein